MEEKKLHVKCPIQWSIFADNYLPNEQFMSSIDEAIVEMASDMPHVDNDETKETSPVASHSLYENITSLVIQSIPHGDTHTYHPCSIQSSIQLAQDLLLVSDVDETTVPPLPTPTPGPATNPMRSLHAQPQRAHSTNGLPERSCNMEQKSGTTTGFQYDPPPPPSSGTAPAPTGGGGTKRNPFKSAMEQFGEDVSSPC